MAAPETILDLLLNLARASDEQGLAIQRDKVLALAAGLAHQAGYCGIAEDCRRRILSGNPDHLFSGFATMAKAMGSDDVRGFLHQLSRLYPFEKAEHLLARHRAAGYAGEHGYHELTELTRSTKASIEQAPRSRRGAGPSSSAWRTPPARSMKKLTSTRPPLIAPAITPAMPASDVSVSIAALRCWVLFAFLLGVASGLAMASVVLRASA